MLYNLGGTNTERRDAAALSAPDAQQEMSETTTKRMPATRAKRVGEDMAKEYRLDYTKAKPNRFAARAKAGYLTVTLDPDVAEVFTNAESVNAVLRALIAAMPKAAQR